MEEKNKIQFADFEKIDIRTGTIISAQEFPLAKKPAYQLTIDFGALGFKKSSAQITTHYSKDQLVGKQIIAVINFPEKQIGTFMSACLVLGAIQKDGSVILLHPKSEVENGSRIS